MRKLGITVFLLLAPIFAFADTHYVSKTGSHTYPYTTWATAADSIQKGINASSYGDTVRVGAGTYREYDITMTSGITLIGTGIDSSIIDASWVGQGIHKGVINGADSSSIQEFHLIGNRQSGGDLAGIGDHYGIPMKFIKWNKFTHCNTAIYISKCPEIINNLIDSCHSGISANTESTSLIQNNTITRCGEGIYGAFSPKYPRIVKNIIHTVGRAVLIMLNDSLLMCNNLIYDVTGVNSVGVGEPTYTKKQVIINNSISGNKWHSVLNSYADSDIRNNIVFSGYAGILTYGSGVVLNVGYNSLWDNTQNYIAEGGGVIDTSLGGNIYLDPMFVGGDNYHLQYGSPCIDAGDPNVKDPDSSRSDIGCYGGIYGETYTYIDYRPKAPDSLSAISESTMIILSWKPNTESDLSHYVVYRDTISWLFPIPYRIVGTVPKDSIVFLDHDFVLGETYYYRITVVDLNGNESECSDLLEVFASSIGEYTETEDRPPVYQLFQNYPNPFNSSTVIWYYMPDIGYQPAEGEITIYNILGMKVRALVHERKYPGWHKATWNGRDDEDNDLPSGIYFCRFTFSGGDVYPLVKPKKMVLLR